MSLGSKRAGLVRSAVGDHPHVTLDAEALHGVPSASSDTIYPALSTDA